jgi:hypothetical protein
MLFQSVTLNIHYPKSKRWSQEVIEDLHSYSAAEDRQGALQVTHTWKDAAQEAIMALIEGDDVGMWDWDENHYLGNIKKNPLEWRKSVPAVHENLCNGKPARSYILIHLYAGREKLSCAYIDAPAIVEQYVEKLFSNAY